MITESREGLQRFGVALLLRYLRIGEAAGPKATAVARAEFQGMCEAADRLDLAHTPDHMHLMVLDSVREAPERPGMNPTDGKPRREWDAAVADRIVLRMLGEVR